MKIRDLLTKSTHNRLFVDITLTIILICIVLGAFLLRTTGLEWDQNYHLHPDERFLTMVETSIQPPQNLGEYFNTAASALNPANRGYTFFVYGTLPIFLVRYVGQWFNQMGYDQINMVGRLVSATFDTATILLIFLIVLRLYKKFWLSILASVFYACAVLPIQLSHYFVVDTVTNFFGFLTFLFAVNIFTKPLPDIFQSFFSGESHKGLNFGEKITAWLKSGGPILIQYVLFGVGLGLAMASKINAVALVVLLPIAALPSLLGSKENRAERFFRFVLPAGIIAGIFTVLTFRIFQPYAFTGPGFFNFKLNPSWLKNLLEQKNLSSPSSNFPPNVQWANRPIWFSLQNLVEWGLGLPLGILGFGSLLWMIWRTIKGEWKKNLLLVVWTVFYFSYQSLVYNRTMRYQMLVYPALCMIAAWGIVQLFKQGQEFKAKTRKILAELFKVGSIVIGIVVVGLTALWAVSFIHIYYQPMTRVAASQWIVQNVPGPINLQIDQSAGSMNQPLAYPFGTEIHTGNLVSQVYTATMDGQILGLTFSHVIDSVPLNPDPNAPIQGKNLKVSIQDLDAQAPQEYQNQIQDAFAATSDPRGDEHHATFDPAIPIFTGHRYQITYAVDGQLQYLTYYGPNTLEVTSEGNVFELPILEPVKLLKLGESYSTTFTPIEDGGISKIFIPHLVDWGNSADQKSITLTLSIQDGDITWFLGDTTVEGTFQATSDIRGGGYWFTFTQPISVLKNLLYTLTLENTKGDGTLAVYGSRQVNETSWDDPLPYGVYGINIYDYFNGVYRTDLNFEMYWEDNAQKLTRLVSDLNQADYFFISSNRQWGSITRLPGQYPLSTTFYRELIGCPEGKEISWCYSQALPGMFAGNLGYQLIQVFKSEPTLGNLSINTQPAEEAFTVYDHPKVFIFKKTSDFDIKSVQNILSAAGFASSNPNTISNAKNGLMLNAEQLQQQQSNGTWSELFDRNALINRYPGIALIVWYLFISLMGWAVYPLVRIGLGGLKDKGYPYAKLAGMLLFAFIVWIAGSFGVAVTRTLTLWVFIGLIVLNGLLFLVYRKTILQELKQNWRHYLLIEGLGLLLFGLFVLVRLGNPDLWHPWKGGEKPMDFSYLNAVIKSTIFPPYDPWFAGGYINYYYFGFVLVGMPVKLLGIIPSIAYNLILPTFFSFVGLGVFSIVWNITHRWLEDHHSDHGEIPTRKLTPDKIALLAGLVAVLLVLILGNLGTVRMIWHGFQYLATGGQSIDGAGFFQRWVWTFQGIAKFISGQNLMFAPGDYYWIPSRAIPGEAITEFPYFTFLYGDPHAHMFALPISIFAIAWALAMVLRKWKWMESDGKKGWLNFALTFVLGGLVIGALRPTNTWDIYTYLPLGIVAVGYAIFRYWKPRGKFLNTISENWRKLIVVIASSALLVGLAFLLYKPFSYWFAQGYNQVDFWYGDHTPFWSYITHWGLFLFVCITWIVWEVRDWLATTPASSLQKMRPFQELIWAGILISLAATVLMLIKGIQIAWLVVPMILLSLILALRPKYPEMRRIVSFLICLGLTLTLVVELVYLKGDLGRMNTVFKIYMQAWTLLAIASAAALVMLVPAIRNVWKEGFRQTWEIGLLILVFSAALFPLLATMDKIRDRMSPTAPHTLDGMAYMPYSSYSDNGVTYSLEQDYLAIQWMQDHIKGSPVIVEGNVTEYRWGTRYTIYTGLPGVVGWNYHQRQQRGVVSAEEVQRRVDEVGVFYSTTDRTVVQNFLKEFNVKYIIVGLMEKAIYPTEGLEKFTAWNGDLWTRIYLDRDTAIYQVSP